MSTDTNSVSSSTVDEGILSVCHSSKEKLKGNRVKIPFVCKHYAVPFLNHFELMRAEGWSY